ncbi:MAG: hypothetical protein JW936_11245 [Sedimentisphaerales bacterium]|nr:hypothetical protein [Sedimentisphaerales bacterium]
MNKHLRTLLILIAFTCAIIALFVWTNDVPKKLSERWVWRIISTVVSAALTFFIIWYEYFKSPKEDKHNTITITEEIKSKLYSLYDSRKLDLPGEIEAGDHLDHSASLRSVKKFFKHKIDLLNFYAQYSFSKSIEDVPIGESGQLCLLSWQKLYDDKRSAIKSLIYSVLTSLFGVVVFERKVFTFKTFHLLKVQELQKLRYLHLKLLVIGIITRISVYVLLFITIWFSFKCFLGMSENYVKSISIALLSMLGLGLCAFLLYQSKYVFLPNKLRHISRKEFLLLSIDPIHGV